MFVTCTSSGSFISFPWRACSLLILQCVHRPSTFSYDCRKHELTKPVGYLTSPNSTVWQWVTISIGLILFVCLFFDFQFVRNYQQALDLMRRATAMPSTKTDYYDEVSPWLVSAETKRQLTWFWHDNCISFVLLCIFFRVKQSRDVFTSRWSFGPCMQTWRRAWAHSR